MLTRHRIAFCGVLLFVVFFLPSADASAYGWDTRLDYNGQLFGFTTTWKDWWDEDVGGDCTNWVWDPEYEEWYCESWLMWENYVTVRRWLYTPSWGLYAAGFDEYRWQAVVPVNAFTPSEAGVWRLFGDHYQKQYIYQDDGWGWVLIGVDEYYLAQSK